jgi:hypothetical protein
MSPEALARLMKDNEALRLENFKLERQLEYALEAPDGTDRRVGIYVTLSPNAIHSSYSLQPPVTTPKPRTEPEEA